MQIEFAATQSVMHDTRSKKDNTYLLKKKDAIKLVEFIFFIDVYSEINSHRNSRLMASAAEGGSVRPSLYGSILCSLCVSLYSNLVCCNRIQKAQRIELF